MHWKKYTYYNLLYLVRVMVLIMLRKILLAVEMGDRLLFFPFPKKGVLGIIKKDISTTLTATAAKIYSAQLLDLSSLIR